MQTGFEITNHTKSNPPITELLFLAMKNKVLGKKYNLSLVCVTPKESEKLHKQHQHKDGPANILSFPLEKNIGEIIICPSFAKREAKKFDRAYPNYLAFLFIHGLLHLKGFVHSSTMEHEEAKIRRIFNI
jgi:probable rRNA maturation factor